MYDNVRQSHTRLPKKQKSENHTPVKEKCILLLLGGMYSTLSLLYNRKIAENVHEEKRNYPNLTLNIKTLENEGVQGEM